MSLKRILRACHINRIRLGCSIGALAGYLHFGGPGIEGGRTGIFGRSCTHGFRSCALHDFHRRCPISHAAPPVTCFFRRFSFTTHAVGEGQNASPDCGACYDDICRQRFSGPFSNPACSGGYHETGRVPASSILSFCTLRLKPAHRECNCTFLLKIEFINI